MDKPIPNPQSKSEENYQIKVAVNIFVINNNQVLLGKRLKKGFGYNKWALPGGHVEYRENLHIAALRELYEETGIKLKELKFLHFVNDITDSYHYIHFNFIAENIRQKPKNMEPSKCAGWEYFYLNKLPEEVFYSHKKFFDAYISDQVYNDPNLGI